MDFIWFMKMIKLLVRSVIKLAYYTYKDNYTKWEELQAGDGYADIVYLPKPRSKYPASSPVVVVGAPWASVWKRKRSISGPTLKE